MKACVFCGACSWGPVRTPSDVPIQTMAATGAVIRPHECVVCDHCGLFAQRALLSETLDPPPTGEASFAALIESGLERMAGKQPPPVTRLERLVGMMLGGPLGTDLAPEHEEVSRAAQRVVYFARCIERELDAPQTSEPQAPLWVSLSFADRDACRTWVLSVLEPAMERLDNLRVQTNTVGPRLYTSKFNEELADAFVWVLETHVTLEAPHA